MTAADRNEWSICDLVRPRSLNAERSGHWTQKAREVAGERERWGWLIRAARVPPMGRVEIDAYPRYSSHEADTGNCYPTVKSAIDALVDVGVIPDDTGKHVARITLHAPDPSGSDRLIITIKESRKP